MSDTIVHIAEDGHIINRNAVRDAFACLKPGDVLMTLKPANKRSLPQNKYYHGCVIPLVLEGLRSVGYNDIRNAFDVHEILKYRFLRKEIPCDNDGPPLEILGSTAQLTTIEFMDYIREIQQWSSEFLGVYIPDPNEQTAFYFPDERDKGDGEEN